MMNQQLTLFDGDKFDLTPSNIDSPALLRDIPFDRIYEAARKEASRKKPAFFVHKYFARRITCNFRMMLLGTLLPENADIWDYLYDSFPDADLSDFTVLDPFMGGGTTLFEACRLNTKVIGCDLQPLSKFVTEALLKKMNVNAVRKALKELEASVAPRIMRYQKTVCPECGMAADVMYTFHVKTVKGKSCCKSHDLFSNYVLALKGNIFTLVCPDCGEVFEHSFKDNGPARCPKCQRVIADPKEGNVNHGKFCCEKCGEEKILSEYTEEDGYPLSTKLVAIEYYCPHCEGHGYKKIETADIELYNEACDEYDRIKDSLPIPDQEIPIGYNTNQILNHGYKRFTDLFNKRQLLGLGLLLKSINEVENKEAQFWLQLAFSGMLEMNNMFCRYQANAYKICNIFFNHAYVPITMPVENNVWGTKLGTGNFLKTIEKVIRGKAFCSKIYDISTVHANGKIEVEKKYSLEKVESNPVDDISQLEVNKPLLRCGDSRDLSFIPDESISLVLTDPPFGANVMYSELIDFFHVWNYKSTLAKELGFIEPFSPKDDEIIVNETRSFTQEDYRNGLTQVFRECNRVLKENGLLIFSFHDRSIESWASILGSICDSGFRLIKAYPLHAETRTGAHTSNKNSIALDIMLVCSKKAKHQSPMTIGIEQEAYKSALKETEDTIQRLVSIDAEITVPDIENIFISKYFCACSSKNADLKEVLTSGLKTVSDGVSQLINYFQDYDFSEKRSGWWSVLYAQKWNV